MDEQRTLDFLGFSSSSSVVVIQHTRHIEHDQERKDSDGRILTEIAAEVTAMPTHAGPCFAHIGATGKGGGKLSSCSRHMVHSAAASHQHSVDVMEGTQHLVRNSMGLTGGLERMATSAEAEPKRRGQGKHMVAVPTGLSLYRRQ